MKTNNTTRILLTGAGGLMGRTILQTNRLYGFHVTAPDKKALDITQKEKVRQFVEENRPHYIINCAAYTQVDQAELEKDRCFATNVSGVKNLVEVSRQTGSILIHLSTDYVFDGEKRSPYQETDPVNPINYYGYTKALSEEIIANTLEKYFIIRPAWIYGKYGNNFFQRVIRWSRENEMLTISNDQISTPTNAEDLAVFILFLIHSAQKDYGIYHFSNEGQTTRYEMARFILMNMGIKTPVKPVPSAFFKPLAQRPAYSVLSKEKIKRKWNYPVMNWKKSLLNFIKKYDV